MTQHWLQKFYYIPVIIAWLFILIKYRRMLGFTPRLVKGELRPGAAVFLPMLAILTVLITLALALPFSYDEAFTFTQFTYPGVQPALCNYPARNKHVFHSILTCATWTIFQFTHSELSVRLPAICFSIFTLYFVFTRYLQGNLYAIVLFSLLYLFSPNIIEFAFQARGYSIQICCAVVSYFFASDNKTTGKLTFVDRLNIILMISVIGMFTSPAYLYTVSCIYLVLVTLNFQSIKKEFVSFLIINAFYGLTLVLLYTPIIASKGLQQLTANPFVAPVEGLSISKRLSYLKELINFLTLPYYQGWLVLLLFIWNTIKQKAYYNIYFLVVPVVLMYVLKQLPFYRVFLPISGILLVNACMTITSSNWFKKITGARSSLLYQAPAFALIAAGCIASYVYFNNYHKKDDLAKAYYFKKIRSEIAGYEKVYTKNIGSDWDFSEILSAYLKLHGIDNAIEIDKDPKEYNFTSSIVLSTERVANFKVVDSTAQFDGQPIFVMVPVLHEH